MDDWKRVIWSDESIFNRFQSDRKQYCWGLHVDIIQGHHIKGAVKYVEGNIMVYGCFTRCNIGPLQNIDGIMRKEGYLCILQIDFLGRSSYPAKQNTFQQYGDPWHTSKTFKEWLNNLYFQLMQWPA